MLVWYCLSSKVRRVALKRLSVYEATQAMTAFGWPRAYYRVLEHVELDADVLLTSSLNLSVNRIVLNSFAVL